MLVEMEQIYYGGNGLSMEDAVIINAQNTTTGVRAEYEYVKNHMGEDFENWIFAYQQCTFAENKSYDVLVYERGEEVRKYYFDITQFFGK
ncbi:MAG: hypothetical protein ACOCVM_00370 [Desulfovibrionaceae bacterium]